MPELESGDYIAELWLKCGRCKSGAMAAAPLEWVDVAAMSSFLPLDAFEADSIIMMSRHYCVGLAMKGNELAPYQPDTSAFTQEQWLARERTIEGRFKAGEDKIKTAR